MEWEDVFNEKLAMDYNFSYQDFIKVRDIIMSYGFYAWTISPRLEYLSSVVTALEVCNVSIETYNHIRASLPDFLIISLDLLR